MRRVFKTKAFHAQMKKSGLTDAALCKAVSEMARGLIDADLGSGVVKKRVALPGAGKSGGARTLIATNRGDRWFFIFGFKKNERDNVSPHELEHVRFVAGTLLALSFAEIQRVIEIGELTEICHD